MAQPVWASKHSKFPLRSKWPKCPWSILGWLKVNTGQNHHKTKLFMFLHQIQATWWFLSTLTKFDPKLTLEGPRNPSFDPSIGTDWNWQKLLNSLSNDYSWVEIGVKTVEISWKLCKEHQLASWGHNFWSYCWISKVFSFLKTTHMDLFGDTKIKPIEAREGLHQVVTR